MGMNVDERAQRREQIVEDLKDGKTIEQIMESHKCSFSLIYTCARAAGLLAYIQGRSAQRARDFRILSRILLGDEPYAKIAADLGGTVQEVWEVHNAAMVAGIPAPDSTKRKNAVIVTSTV